MTDEIVSLPGLRRLLDDLGAECDPASVPVEGWCGLVPLYRPDTIARWVDLGCPSGLPPSPELRAFGVNDLVERMGVGVDAVRKWVLAGRLVSTWQVDTLDTVKGRPMLLWSRDDMYGLLPDCPGGHKVEVVRVQSRPGTTSRVLCSCAAAEWVEVVVPMRDEVTA